ncbi:MAG: hypothetical protein PVH42_14605, partial [Desulfobacterales bacterium]
NAPLLVITGGQVTVPADAWLIDNSIADKICVLSVSAEANNKEAFGGFNDCMDPWACYILLEKLDWVILGKVFKSGAPEVTKEWIRDSLPDTPLRQWMIDKVHPVFPDRYPGNHDWDGHPVCHLLTDAYAVEYKKVSFDGWYDRKFAGMDIQLPKFKDDANGNNWVITKANRKVGSEAWRAAMSNPDAWGKRTR